MRKSIPTGKYDTPISTFQNPQLDENISKKELSFFFVTLQHRGVVLVRKQKGRDCLEDSVVDRSVTMKRILKKCN
jgi:hypothetical protein